MLPLPGDEVLPAVGPRDPEVRLWSKVRGPWSSGLDELGRPFAIGDRDCWLWIGGASAGGFRIINGRPRAVVRPGYGRIRWRSEDGRWRLIGAHVAAWLVTHGPFDRGLEIDHTCERTLCCNPNHLRAVAHSENVRAVYERRRRVAA